MIGTTEIALLVGAAVLLFGVDKLPKLARSAGLAKKEFMVGQAEADMAAENAREEARKRAAANASTAAPATPNGAASGVTPDPPAGGTAPTTTAPPHVN